MIRLIYSYRPYFKAALIFGVMAYVPQGFAQVSAPKAQPAPASSTAAPTPAPATAPATATAQTPAPAAPAKLTEAQVAAQAAANYENLLNEYYKTQIVSNRGFVKGTIKFYRRESKKTDAQYNLMDTPEYEDAARTALGDYWKSLLRKKLSAQELQYLIAFEKSALRKKLFEVEVLMNNNEALGSVFMSVFEKIKKAPPAKR